MATRTTTHPNTLAAPDLSRAVELAPRVWWVGSMLPEDQLQCHVYLIEQADQSVLIDPGSVLTQDEMIRKVDGTPAVNASVGVAVRRKGESCTARAARRAGASGRSLQSRSRIPL